MATALDQILLANKDHDVLMALLSHYRNYPEWVVTVAFYKALHIVDAVCLESGFVPCGHAHRLDLLKRRPAWQPIHRHYQPLWIASGIARYLFDSDAQQGYGKFIDYMPVDDVVTHAVGKRLLGVEQTALQAMKSPELKKRLKQLDPAKLPVIPSSPSPPPASTNPST